MKLSFKNKIVIDLRKLMLSLVSINFTLHLIDFFQSLYYLNRYGFHYEINPLITNNFSLVWVKIRYFGSFGFVVLLLTYLNSKKAQEWLKENKKYRIIFLFAFILTFLLFLIDFFIILPVVFNNLIVIINAIIYKL